MSTPFALRLGRTEPGYALRVEGRGTLRESPAVHAFVRGLLETEPPASLVLDLAGCTYLDSTFLGAVLDLHRRYGETRFRVAAPADVAQRLLGPLRLERLLQPLPAAPPVLDTLAEIHPGDSGERDRQRHVLDCHRCLAELDEPSRERFGPVVERLARELAASDR